MSLVQTFSLAPGFNPDRVLPAVNKDYFAIPVTRTTVGVWSFDKLELRHKPLELQGHSRTISALAFGNNFESKLLCSCAGDYVIVWDVDRCQRNFSERAQIKGEIIATSIGEANHCSFSADDSLVAVCVDIDVHILKSSTQSTVAILDGHLSRVTGAEFCPHYSSTVVTISDNRTFKIWDLEHQTLVYQSCVITAFSLVCLCMNWSEPTFSVGSTDGIIRTFDLTDGNDFRVLHQIDIDNISRKINTSKTQTAVAAEGPKTISSRQTWKKPDNIIPAIDRHSKDGGGVSSCAIVGLAYAYPKSHLANHDKDVPNFLRSAVTDMLANRSAILLVATTSSILQIDPKTLETLVFEDMADPICSEGNFASSYVTLNALNFTAFTCGQREGDIWAIVGTLFENRIHVLDWVLAVSDLSPTDDDDEAQTMDLAMELLSLQPDLNPDRERNTKTSESSLVAVNPLCENSLLNSKLVPNSKSKQATLKKKSAANPSARKSISLNQPLTFKNKIKSSGYSKQAPQGKLFQPQIGKTKPASTMKRSISSNPVLLTAEYPLNCGHPDEMVLQRNICDNPTSVLSLRFSGNGQFMACGLANKLAMTYSMPLKKSGSIFQSHDAPVNSVYWSHDNSMLVTSSDDRSAIVWMTGSAEPIMKISTTNDITNSDSSSSSKTNPEFSKEVKAAQFYYMDKFILLISGNTFYMYKYYCDTSKDEIKRYMTKSKYKLVKSWPTESQSLTALAAVNSFYSHVAVCAGSNRSFAIYDLNEGRNVSIVEDAHSRPIHAISLNEGSSYVSQPSSAYNVFATAAIADCIRLWDIRTRRCVQRFEGHQNKALPCGIAVSPCGQYLASGSEDKLTYIFDIRTGTYCDRLRGHSDVVSTVAYHPVKPLLASGSTGGNVVLYKPENWKK